MYSINPPPPNWLIDGMPVPRNPESFEWAWDKAAVTYEPQADGSEVRVSSPKILRGGNCTMTWKNAGDRLVQFLMQYFNPSLPTSNVHVITLSNTLPPRIANVFFDTPKKTMSQDIFTRKLGSGGVKHDIVLALRMAPYFRSTNLVPTGTSPPSSYVLAAFAGPIGNGQDGYPVWTGKPWWFDVDQTKPGIGQVFRFDNLGTAPWSPTIMITGKIDPGSFIHNPTDVDGSGQGVRWTWTGTALLDGDYILLDTNQKRVWLYTASNATLVEVYTWTVTTASDGQPFMFWPAFNPGANLITFLGTGLDSQTTVDISNNGQEQFNYY